MTIIYLVLLFYIVKLIYNIVYRLKKKKQLINQEKQRRQRSLEKALQQQQKRIEQQEKEKQRIQRQKEKEKAQQKKLKMQKSQALEDLPFYDIQLQRLYISVEDTRNQYKKAVEKVEVDSRFNRIHSSAIKEKVVNQHIEERDKTLKKLIILENQIHSLEKKKAAAENLLKDG